MEALVPLRIISNIPGSPVPWGRSWNLVSLQLANQDYGTPKAVDLLIGADVFSHMVLRGWRFRPTRSPSALKTQFGWVLAGTAGNCCHNLDTGGVCYLATTIEDVQGSDELLRKFWEIKNPYFQQPMLSIDEKEAVEYFKRTHYRDEKGRFVVPLPVKGMQYL